MKKIKLCSFTVNYTHSCIIANNFIQNELSNVKVVYINEKSESKKINSMINRFYSKMKDSTFFTEWLNEKVVNDYENETFVFVVSGRQKFVNRVNSFLNLNDFNGYIIDCYEVFESSLKIEDIVSEHDFYLNTTGIVKKETFNLV